MKLAKLWTIASIVLLIGAVNIWAQNIMPDFATLPSGWVTDRYEPAAFQNVGTYQGRANVLGISINSSTSESNRPPAYADLFYATQGRQFAFSPAKGPASVLSSELFVPASWAYSVNGNVRSDMWGVMTDSSNSISAYPIIGFTNYGGSPRFRVWDDDFGWIDAATPVNYDSWNRFAIELKSDSSVNYYINGTLVYTDLSTGNSVAFSAAIMQAYNFESTDPRVAGAVIAPYTAHWSNSFTNSNQCKNNGWKAFSRADGSTFKNQGDCIQYINTGK